MIAIVDFGSQYTQLIAKRLRRLGFQAQVFHSKTTAANLEKEFQGGRLQGIVLSGSPSSVGTGVDPDVSLLEMNLPVLAICFGYQFIAKHFGGKVEPSTHREYGQAWVERVPGIEAGHFLSALPDRFRVWMSHGDSVVAVPQGAQVFLRSEGKIAAFWMPQRRIWALQFHPEVYHSQFGEEIFKNFADKICGVPAGEWSVSQALEQVLEKLRHKLRDVPELYCAVSGGTDSTVLAVLLSQVTRVKAIMVDHGFLREYDQSDLKKFFAPYPNIDLEVIDAREVFWKELHGVTDPEKKRKTIGRLFIETFYSHIGVPSGQRVHLGQGTIYSDVIESAKAGSGVAHNIKSHHNVGGLPEGHRFILVEPLREFFKDEVREIGKILGIQSEAIDRHPFPGPGLAIRCLGEMTPERIEILRKADELFIAELRRRYLYSKTWQAFCVLLPVSTVGVMGDARSYENVLALRAVSSTDAMTAEASRLPLEELCEIANLIVNQVRGVNRVVYDLTGKPPATIEWE